MCIANHFIPADRLWWSLNSYVERPFLLRVEHLKYGTVSLTDRFGPTISRLMESA